MEIVEEVFEKVDFFCRGKLIELIKSLPQEEYDTILDARDEDEFSEKWMEVYADIKKMLKNRTVDSGYTQKIESLRERTFKAIVEQSGSSDLAAYLSDDLALLVEAVLCQYTSSWLNGVWKEYSVGKIPHGKISLVDGRLDKMIALYEVKSY